MPHVDIFFSYAHEDEELMHAVRRQLVLFDRQGILSKWFDRKIRAGQEWRGQIDHNLKHAGIILLFVSPHFFESDYCYDVEMVEALRRHDNGEAVVIPVILRPCAWHTAPFGRLQAAPRDGRPITKWSDQDEACLDVANHIVEVVLHFDEIRHAQRRTKLVKPKTIQAVSPSNAMLAEGLSTKLELIAAARTQGRRICGCTETGEIMLLKKHGLGGQHRWECPHCKRREKATDVPRHFFQ
jgi:hypothetical protein